MSETLESIRAFVEYGRSLSGYEKGEAQVFCDRALPSVRDTKATKRRGPVSKVRSSPGDKATKFIDLLWRPRLLLEMKSRGENLQKHYQQAFDYWLNATPDRPQYVVLCNFDEFWVYDFNFQLHEPVDRLGLGRSAGPIYGSPIFCFRTSESRSLTTTVSLLPAQLRTKVAQVFNALVARGEDRDKSAAVHPAMRRGGCFRRTSTCSPKGCLASFLDDCAGEEQLLRSFGWPVPPNEQRDAARAADGLRRVAYFKWRPVRQDRADRVGERRAVIDDGCFLRTLG